MTLLDIIFILFIHWIADFVFQTHYQATNKSKSLEALFSHTVTYSMIWWLALVCYMKFSVVAFIGITLFTSFTFILHSITDYFTSKLNARLWAKGDTHNFFVSVGFDQLLHYIQLLLTFYIFL